MKLKTLVYLVTVFLIGQTPAMAEQSVPSLTPSQAQRLSRDLVPSNSQDFFNRGQNLIEREIQILRKKQNSSTKPILKVNPQAPTEKDFPQNDDRPDILPKQS
ncbi:MAG: hypothetical protein SAK29_20320 [Scytonema sp. PMC 1069.18]|nr:hypothetical protein [Scytonema sp. PMC 1069.18]MEC4881214.1 hypothetical protein [Scytonema sp. PMC 1070.18]